MIDKKKRPDPGQSTPVARFAPPDLHPDVVDALHGRGLDKHARGADVLKVARAGMAAIYSGVDAISAASDAVSKMPRDPATLERFRVACEARFASAARDHDRAVEALGKHEAALAAEVAAALKHDDAHALEIRRHVKGLRTTERLEFVEKSIESGDLAVVGAVTGAPAFLSGLTADATAVLRDVAAVKFAPAAHTALVETRRVIGRLGDARSTFAREAAGVAMKHAPRIEELSRDDALAVLAKLVDEGAS